MCLCWCELAGELKVCNAGAEGGCGAHGAAGAVRKRGWAGGAGSNTASHRCAAALLLELLAGWYGRGRAPYTSASGASRRECQADPVG